ncbi:MAG: S-layer homology domain-containing protein [Clostridia bacterium]|nr:S-layer homology domain-containing protein [Clostridia bacterium]
MKKFMSVLLVVLIISGLSCTAFADVPKEVEAFPKIYAHGMLVGRGDGDFALDALVTRAEMAQFAVNAMNLKNVPGNFYYTDLEGHWALGSANLAHNMGAIPWDEKELQPESAVTYGEAAEILVTILGYAPKAEAIGEQGFMMTATSLGITNGISFVAQDFATRKDIATMLENAMDVPLMQQVGFGAYEEFQIMDGKNGVPLMTLEKNFQ